MHLIMENKASGARPILRFVCGIMDLCWLFSWAIFAFSGSIPIHLPSGSLLGTYLISFLIPLFFFRLNYRLFYRIGAQTLAFLILTAASLFSNELLAMPRQPIDCLLVLLTIFAVGLFWYKGLRLANNKRSYKVVCHYFDIGIAMFFVLFLVKLLVRIKGETDLDLGPAYFLLILFLFSGLTAIFSSIHPVSAFNRGSKKGYVIWLIITSFLILIALGCVIYFNPAMTATVDHGYTVLKRVGRPLSPFFIWVVKFLFSPGKQVGHGKTASGDSNFSGPASPGDNTPAGLIDSLMHYLLEIVILIMAVSVAGFIIYKIGKWLMQKKSPEHSRPRHFNFLQFFFSLKALKEMMRRFIFKLRAKVATAQDGYGLLIKWGKRSGLTKKTSETPLEYTDRLGTHFHDLNTEFQTVAALLHLEVYSQKKMGSHHLQDLKKALRKIKKPRYWWIRFKTLFFFSQRPSDHKGKTF